MTREEALNKAINIVRYFEAHFAKSKEAREDAVNIIDALEQEPCTDAISRQAAIDVLTKTSGIRGDALKALYDLPPVTPTESENLNKWIPVSERLPKKNMACLVAVGKFNLTQMAMYSDLMGTIDHRIFYQGDYEYDSFEDITEYVKAWMPLPLPYKASPTGAEGSDKE